MYSSPRPQWLMIATRLPCVPLATKSAASLPSIAAMRSCSALTLGSSPKTSSPTSATAIAARIAAVGRVTVSLRRSTIFMSPPALPSPCPRHGTRRRDAQRRNTRPGTRPGSWSAFEKVLQHRVAMLREDRFRMELHAFERRGRGRQVAVANAHDLTVFAGRGHVERGRQRRLLDGQRVVADNVEVARQTGVEAAPIGRDAARLAVHQPRGANDAAAERSADGLVAEADAEDRQLAREGANRLDADARLGR